MPELQIVLCENALCQMPEHTICSMLLTGFFVTFLRFELSSLSGLTVTNGPLDSYDQPDRRLSLVLALSVSDALENRASSSDSISLPLSRVRTAIKIFLLPQNVVAHRKSINWFLFEEFSNGLKTFAGPATDRHQKPFRSKGF